MLLKNTILVFVVSWVLVAFTLPVESQAQIKLQMDKFGKRKSLDSYEGQTILVRMKQEKRFRPLEIKKLYPDAHAMLTQHGLIQLDDIIRVRTYKRKNLNKLFKGLAISYGGSLLAYSTVAYVGYKTPYNWELIGGSLIGIGVTWLTLKIFNRKTYKIGKRRKLRIIDLNVLP